MLPMDHIGAGGVRPMHRSPERAIRVVLKKHVVATLVEDGSVRIVHPVLGGSEVKLGTISLVVDADFAGFPESVRQAAREQC